MKSMKPSYDKRGFTLIEVVMALAIYTFAFVSLTSLLSMTILNHKQAISNTVIAQITQQLAGEVQMCGPAEFATYNNQQWGFDYEGNQLASVTAPGVVYRAQTVVTSVQLSGELSASSSLQLVKIYAVADPTATGTILSNQVASGAGVPNRVIVVDQPAALAGGL